MIYKFRMLDDNGQIATDFLLGLSLFLIALMFVIQFIPGMFIPSLAGESSLDYTAYRTASILAEDTGWWGNSTSSATDWENHPDNIMRIGLANDNDINSRLTNTPNMLSKNKINSMLLVNETALIEKLGLYNNVDGTRFSYGYNISITKNNAPLVLNNTAINLGEALPDDRDISKITRIVLVETGVIANFDAKNLPTFNSSVEDTIINITGPYYDGITLQISNLSINGTDPSFKKLTLDDGVVLNNLNEGPDYTPYKLVNGTRVPLTSTGKIDNGDTVIFCIEPGLLNGSQTYQLIIDLKDVTFTKTAPPYLDYTQHIEKFYEPAYLTVEVWR
jgi:hypothetical protein